MAEKKKICFYCILSSGHFNVCSSIGSLILNKYEDTFEVWFIVDKQWHERLLKIDNRFKFGVFDYTDPDAELRLDLVVKALESCLEMNSVDKLAITWKYFTQGKSFMEVDAKSEAEILKIKPDFLICDQGWHLPAMMNSGVPYAFVVSTNPLIFNFDGFPQLGSDARLDDKEAIEKFRKEYEPHKSEMRKCFYEFFKERGVEFKTGFKSVDNVLSDHFSLYTYAQEVDYFNAELKEKYKLWQIDTPLFPERIPKPFVPPDEFAKLPEKKCVYVSLGSLFSAYTHLLQRLVDILDRLPYKYIVSKGLYGDKLKFPSNKFIGENYVDQLAVLQIADGMIAHGGNNTFGECFYFGVPAIILPVIGDQFNNGARLEETGYGYQLDVMNYTEEQLADRLSKILNDEKIRLKCKAASKRIQEDNRINLAVDRIVDYVKNL